MKITKLFHQSLASRCQPASWPKLGLGCLHCNHVSILFQRLRSIFQVLPGLPSVALTAIAFPLDQTLQLGVRFFLALRPVIQNGLNHVLLVILNQPGRGRRLMIAIAAPCFEQANMEDIVSPEMIRQLELISYWTPSLQHVKGTNKLGSQFLGANSLERDILRTEQHLVAHIELYITQVPICIGLVSPLCSFQG